MKAEAERAKADRAKAAAAAAAAAEAAAAKKAKEKSDKVPVIIIWLMCMSGHLQALLHHRPGRHIWLTKQNAIYVSNSMPSRLAIRSRLDMPS